MSGRDLSIPEQTIEVLDVLGKKIRTTSQYWDYIINVKHREARGKLDIESVMGCIREPDEIRLSDKKSVVYYYKRIKQQNICAVVRHLNEEGFLITSYLTSKKKRVGKQIWPKT